MIHSSLSGSKRILVCLHACSPHAAALVRKAAQICGRMGLPWYAVYVQTPPESLERIDAATNRQIVHNLDLARQLGATYMEFRGADPVNILAAFSQGVRHHARHRGP